jgi:hypothetical protein
MMTDTLTEIREFVRGHVGGLELGDHDRIFDTGYVKSMFVVRAAVWAADTFGVVLDGADLDIRNFQTIASLHGLIVARMTARVAEPAACAAA